MWSGDRVGGRKELKRAGWRDTKERLWQSTKKDKQKKEQDIDKWESRGELFIFWLCLKVLGPSTTYGMKSIYTSPRWFFFPAYWQHYSLSFPVLFTLSLMCSHFNVPSRPLGSLHSFHGCPNFAGHHIVNMGYKPTITLITLKNKLFSLEGVLSPHDLILNGTLVYFRGNVIDL